MIHRERIVPPRHVYSGDEWSFVEKKFYPRFLPQMETVFSIGNGYIGMRGNFEEGSPAHLAGTYVNGFYESWPIVYGEEAYGFAKHGQTMLNVPDAKIIKLFVDDEPFYLPTANLLAFERSLNMKEGALDREILWETPSGKHISIKSRRLVSFKHRHLAAISYRVTVKNANVPVVISSEVIDHLIGVESEFDPRKAQILEKRVLINDSTTIDDHRILLGYRTENSGMTLACGVDHEMRTDCAYTTAGEKSEDGGKIVFSIEAKAGVPIGLTKYITYHTSRRVPSAELVSRAGRTLDRARGQGFESILKEQRGFLDDFWEKGDVRVEASPKAPRGTREIQQAIRFNLFHVMQAAARAEGTGIPAKGLTGQAYEGHYFWDIEVYVLPFLIYTAPRIARNLLKLRHSMLDKARNRAREVNQTGALFPWRTINGDEASAYYAAGTAQYHINADIMYALKKYVEVTGDYEFLHDSGSEMLVETARLWRDLGHFNAKKAGKFCINGVTGPDEYNTVVDNNAFTNLMARENLRYAAETVELLKREKPDKLAVLVDRTGLDLSEVEEWKKAADMMYIPYDEERGIHLQDDSFQNKERWDFENTPREKYPLLLHYHPLVIYRYRVIKQADMVLAMFLLGNEFTLEEKKRNFDYYDDLTTGDSSLSVCIQSIVAAEVGDMEKSLEYARYALLMDLADVGGNVADGCHIASMGGTWMILVYGLAGMRDYGGRISFKPRLYDRIDRLRFHLTIRGQTLGVDIDRDFATYTLVDGDGLSIFHEDREIRLSPDQPAAKRPLSGPANV
ncbi:MAG: glycoside hydrolase family 65 protein [Deltaproteobacteria bacterium]|nr:glycoside hydrolase family 65 protein [Deltaproteobacteria bacterium]NIS76254.1 glycoside hydrolase family 65 protein [Deltaproteobacteria bacterium]